MDFVAIDSIKKDFDLAMMHSGYVRTKIMAEHWGMTPDKLNQAFKKGYTCDCFVVNGVKYMSVTAEKPEGV